MPKLTEQNIEKMQPLLRQMMGHTSNEYIKTAHLSTTNHHDKPLVSDGFYICTGLVLLYHNKQGGIEPTLCHLSTPHLGQPIRGFLEGLQARAEKEGGLIEAVFVTGGKSMGKHYVDPEAGDMKDAIAEVISPEYLTIRPTIKNPRAEAFGLAYMPPKHSVEGMVCVRDYASDAITPHFPFEVIGKAVGVAQPSPHDTAPTEGHTR